MTFKSFHGDFVSFQQIKVGKVVILPNPPQQRDGVMRNNTETGCNCSCNLGHRIARIPPLGDIFNTVVTVTLLAMSAVQPALCLERNTKFVMHDKFGHHNHCVWLKDIRRL